MVLGTSIAVHQDFSALEILRMPTTIPTIRYSGHPTETRYQKSNAPGNRNAQFRDCALLIAWAVIMLMVSAAAHSRPEATAMTSFQLLATF